MYTDLIGVVARSQQTSRLRRFRGRRPAGVRTTAPRRTNPWD